MRRFRRVVLVLLQVTLVCLAADVARAQSAGVGLPGSEQTWDTQALRVLAEQGDKRAAFLLGSRYASGRGVPRDDSEAVRWFTAAAEGGLAEAQYNLGIMYISGRGVPRNAAKAAQWYELAAKQGLTEAQFNLGALYGTGRGVARDEKQAAQWFAKAARRGLAPAQFNLGALYEHGRGVRLNAHTALEWYQKAEEQGFGPAKLRRLALQKKLQAGASPDSDGRPSADSAALTSAAEAVPQAAAAPARAASPSAKAGSDWVLDAPPTHFTMQLASYSKLAEARRFADSLGDELPVGIYASTKRGQSWFSVVRGSFASYKAASDAAANLPARLRKLKPWVRNFAQIHKQMR